MRSCSHLCQQVARIFDSSQYRDIVFSILGLSRPTASVCNHLPSSTLAHGEMLDMSNFVYFWVFLSMLRWNLTMRGSCGDCSEGCCSRGTESFELAGGLVPSVTQTLTGLGTWRWSMKGSVRELAVPGFLGGLEKGRNKARRCAREEAFRETPVAELDGALIHLISSTPTNDYKGTTYEFPSCIGSNCRVFVISFRGPRPVRGLRLGVPDIGDEKCKGAGGEELGSGCFIPQGLMLGLLNNNPSGGSGAGSCPSSFDIDKGLGFATSEKPLNKCFRFVRSDPNSCSNTSSVSIESSLEILSAEVPF